MKFDVCAPWVHKLGPETAEGDVPESRLCARESPAVSPGSDCAGFVIADYIRFLFSRCQVLLCPVGLPHGFRRPRIFRLPFQVSIETKTLLGFVS
jgi:hypothetical protein